MDNFGIEEVKSDQCVCQTCEVSMKECMRKNMVEMRSEICVVFQIAQPQQAFVSIRLVGQRHVVQLKLQALIVIR